ncbi:glycosyltransferase family 4 protein [Sphingopyxis terrae]|uniref:Glycosyltransferase involved in cell wall bisynthesis n=2 Tax=Sphingopyxis terrae TaxID=33052 RepID=A0A1Y6FTP7_9SPHN|nr:glycosyltransferase family 4 protein [Sphingopyxis terrae]PCF91874.1 glycosyl transferase family 1 [Sphingopyxis terrae subsp. ummariensis]SMQ76520.1 Glycosyltransferase involved in cell wall bisynthesis [Sphingopyxis terrae subsp. ummariensis]
MRYEADDSGAAGRLESDRLAAAHDAGNDNERRGAARHRVALVSCFRPRRCGIATFAADLHDHLREQRPDIALDIYPLEPGAPGAEPDSERGDPSAPRAISADDLASYRRAAEAIAASKADIVWIQHEFGIFGGPAGAHILGLVEHVAAPLVVTFHTLLSDPTADQRHVMDRLVARAARLVVMNEFGRRLLIDHYGAAPDRIAVIEHGTPDRPFRLRSPLRDQLGLGDRPILSTFGLLGPGKGLETAVRALPAIAATQPDVLYRIVGATHPNLVAHEGETYRDSLVALAERLGVADNIAWDNRFLDPAELVGQIELCDIFIAPYPNLAQISSGTLAYAIALGRAAIATPFVHARELLGEENGLIVPPGDSDALAEAVVTLLAVPEERERLQRRAYARGRSTTWPVIARAYGALLSAAADRGRSAVRIDRARPSLAGLAALCDDTGLLQHAIGPVPDRNHGYCSDDNARALILVNTLGAEDIGKGPPARGQTSPLAYRFAAFLQHAWNEEAGQFRNFMAYDRRWLEASGSEDSNGRILWALGHCARHARSPDLRAWAADWFARSSGMAAHFQSPRAHAFAMIGADHRLAAAPGDGAARKILEQGAAFLHRAWKKASSADWRWFEPVLAYDNARLCEAMLRAGRTLPSLPYAETGLSALAWLQEKQTAPRGHFRPVGSEGFGRAHLILPFDQQPLEAAATIDACAIAEQISREGAWRAHAERAFGWFFGANDRGCVLADAVGGRCFDGLTPHGVNSNSGAESTLAYHLARAAMAAGFWQGGSAAAGIEGDDPPHRSEWSRTRPAMGHPAA